MLMMVRCSVTFFSSVERKYTKHFWIIRPLTACNPNTDDNMMLNSRYSDRSTQQNSIIRQIRAAGFNDPTESTLHWI